MGKALMVLAQPDGNWANGDETNFFGGSDQSTESNTQVSCTEDATFSLMAGRILSGNSGTATLRFRDAGANGNQTFQIVGSPGAAEDATNTDVLSAGDLFNVAYTDTGTNSVPAWMKVNVEFASGHGNFHGGSVFGGAVFDVASATRFICLGGSLTIDGNATENSVEWKNRGYTSFEALQVRVSANARTNTSTFKNRIDSGDGSLQIDYAAGATGLVTDTSPSDSLSDGQTINASITLDTGVEDLTVRFVGATLKSSSNKSEIWAGVQNGVNRVASSTAFYYPIGGSTTGTNISEENARIKVGFAAVVSNLRCYLSANNYAGNATLKLYQNGSAVLTTTITASGGAAWYENNSDTITIDADDELSFEFDEGTSGTITIQSVGITFAPVAAPGGTILPQMMQHGLFLGMRT